MRGFGAAPAEPTGEWGSPHMLSVHDDLLLALPPVARCRKTRLSALSLHIQRLDVIQHDAIRCKQSRTDWAAHDHAAPVQAHCVERRTGIPNWPGTRPGQWPGRNRYTARCGGARTGALSYGDRYQITITCCAARGKFRRTMRSERKVGCETGRQTAPSEFRGWARKQPPTHVTMGKLLWSREEKSE